MGKRKPNTKIEWEIELSYIQRIAETNDLSSFNNNLITFKNYVNMQAKFAEEDGYKELADKMRYEIRGE